MTLRIMGALLLVAAAIAMGLSLRAKEKKRLSALAQAAEFVRSARRSIELFSTPTEELFGSDAPEKVRQSLCAELGEDAPLMQEFFDRLGSGYKADTLRLCDFIVSALQDRMKNAEKDYPARARLYTAMPVLLAISIIVLIL